MIGIDGIAALPFNRSISLITVHSVELGLYYERIVGQIRFCAVIALHSLCNQIAARRSNRCAILVLADTSIETEHMLIVQQPAN
jgi:hypothetical protein